MSDTREVYFRKGDDVDVREFTETLASISEITGNVFHTGKSYHFATGENGNRERAFTVREGYDSEKKIPFIHISDGTFEITDEAIQRTKRCIGLKLDNTC